MRSWMRYSMYIISLILVALIVLPSLAVGKPPEDKGKDKDNGKPPKTEDKDNGKPPKTEDEDNGKPPNTKDEVKFLTITSSSGPNGNVSPSGSVKVKIGDDQRFKVSANGGYRIKRVVVNGEDGETVFSCETENNEHVRKWEYSFENVQESQDTYYIYAEFDRDVFTIKALARGAGTISPPGAVKVTYEGSQDFTIRATRGFCIDDVQISPSDDKNNLDMDVAKGASTYTFSFNGVTSDYTIIVTFARLKEPEPDPKTDPEPLTIESEAEGAGRIDPSGKVEVEYGSDQEFIMTPEPCHRISAVLVDDELVDDDVYIDEETGIGTYTFTDVASDHTIKATFEEITYTITATSEGFGGIDPSEKVEVVCGSEQIFTITPGSCHSIAGILVDDGEVAVDIDEETGIAKYTFSDVASDHTIHAIFEESIYTITPMASEGGSIDPPEDVLVECGGSQTFTIIPGNPCHTISEVLVDDVPVDLDIDEDTGARTYTFSGVTSDHNIKATFEKITYNIKATAGDGGSIDPSEDVLVECGGSQTFTIIPGNPCHIISEVLVDDVPVDLDIDEDTGARTYTFSDVTSNHTIKTTFEEITEPHIIETLAEGGGSIVPSGEVEVSCSLEQVFTIKPDDPCHRIAVVEVDDVPVDVDIDEVTGEVTYTFSNVTSNHTIRAKFEEVTEPYTIAVTSGVGGSIAPPEDVLVECGGSQTFTIIPDNPCHCISEVLVDNVPVDVDVDEDTGARTYTFSDVASDHTIHATFKKTTHTITATAGEHGSIDPSGDVQVECGGSQLFRIRPEEGYTRGSVLVDTIPVKTKGNKYEFTDVDSDHIIEVTFVEDLDEDDLKGDVNNDGKVNSGDAIFILLIILGKIEPTEQQELAADVNGDGVIDINDALFVLNIVAGLAAPDANFDSTLLQNFPNPFNPETWIPFRLSEGSEVTIEIYDAMGHLVRRLPLGHKSAGFYTSQERAAYWDGRNEDGERAASGVYFYAIRAGDFADTKKMIIAQ